MFILVQCLCNGLLGVMSHTAWTRTQHLTCRVRRGAVLVGCSVFTVLLGVMVYHACTVTASRVKATITNRRHSSLAWCCRLCPGLYQSLTKVHSRDKMQFWTAVAGWREVFMMNSAKAGSRPSLTLSSSDRTSSLARSDITSPFFSSFVSYNLKMYDAE